MNYEYDNQCHKTYETLSLINYALNDKVFKHKCYPLYNILTNSTVSAFEDSDITFYREKVLLKI